MTAWMPTDRQQDALERREYEVLFGGARGGGKTAAGMAWLLYDIDNPKYRALVIRHQAKDLVDWIDRARSFYSDGEVVGQPAEVRFRSGAIIRTGHLGDANAYQQYQGHEYHRILIEELTQIPSEEQYLRLLASCRSTIPELRPQIFATTNPDGAGFGWVKKRWQIEGAPDKIIRTIDPITGLPRVFVPARVKDNPHLVVNDPQYLATLDGLPDGLREAWRDGSWADPVFPGAYYAEALMQARREGRIKLIPYDPTLLTHTVWDLGIGEQLVCGFFQRTSTETRLIDTWQGKGNDGLPEAAVMLQNRKYRYGTHFAPHDANKTETGTGQTIIQQAEKVGIHFSRVPAIPINDGIQKALMMFPRLYISEPKCERFIEAIRQYRKKWDDRRLDWLEEPFKDWTNHYADMERYAAIIEDKMINNHTSHQSFKPKRFHTYGNN